MPVMAAPGRMIRGYAATFDSPSSDLGGYIEIVRAGAFADVLAGRPDVRALVNHDPNLVLGRTTAGTLRLAQDGRGLAVEIDIPDTSYAADLVASMARGDIGQMSFQFTAGRDRWTQPEGRSRLLTRELLQVQRLYDVSIVTFPAYTATTAALRCRSTGRHRPALGLKRRKLALWSA